MPNQPLWRFAPPPPAGETPHTPASFCRQKEAKTSTLCGNYRLFRQSQRKWENTSFPTFKFIQEFANSSDVNPECAAERFKSALISGSDSVELPLAAVAVQFADDQRGFD